MATQTAPDQVSLSTWTIDAARSRVDFAIRKRRFFVQHLTVKGRFADVAGTIALDTDAPERSHVDATVQTGSIDTQNRRRDKHLRSADFFDVQRYPRMRFASSAVLPVDAASGRYRIAGTLTLLGTAHEVVLEARVGADQDPQSSELRFTATTTLNRHDLGLHWNSAVLKIYDDVSISLDIRALRA